MSIEKHNDSLRREYFVVGATVVRLPAHELAHVVDGTHGPQYYQIPRQVGSVHVIGHAGWRVRLLGHFWKSVRDSRPALVERRPAECECVATCPQES